MLTMSAVALAKADYLCDSRPLMPERPRSIPVSSTPMHDIKSIRDDAQAFDEGLKRRGLAPMSQELLALDDERKGAIQLAQDAQERRNKVSKEIGQAKAAKDDERVAELMQEM